ncbi:MAG: FAD-dependent oxidoreductase, partial [Candidatus Promineifilaceae bacterium]|nr:FAD-dependent oxidoreductase [Candidatus Promineifilaceae bacterium]
MSNIVIIGGNYAGIAAAFELRSKLSARDVVTVVSINEEFVFYPSLIWVVQGERDLADISFPIRPVFEEAGIQFISSRAEEIDIKRKSVLLANGQDLLYDKLVIATGGIWNWGATPGLMPKPEGETISILTPWSAEKAREDWRALVAN